MVDCLIFSKNRACQLDLLLRSIRHHARGFYASLTVLWTATSRDFGRAYQRCCHSEHDRVRFTLETSFQRDVYLWLRHGSPLVSFLVDDDVFYRAPPATIPRLPLSLRGDDYWYPFSLDGNVYQRADVAALLEGCSFRNPNELEHAGHLNAGRLPFTEVVPCEPPCLVGWPLNTVSSTSGLPNMGVKASYLNALYLDGYRIPLPKVAEGVNLGAHAELPLELAA